MQINGINGIYSIPERNIQQKANEVKKQPQSTSFGNFNPFLSSYNSEEIAQYKKDFANTLNNKKEELYSILNNMKLIGCQNGNITSVEDALKSLFSEKTEYKTVNNLLHKTPEANVNNIIENGFDTSKISKTEYGPGIYFGFSEGALDIYSGKTLKAEYEGNTAHGTNIDQYNELKRNMTSELSKALNKPMMFSQYGMAEHEVLSQFVNEFCTKKISDDLGIDGATTNSREGYFIVFNKNAIKNISVKN